MWMRGGAPRAGDAEKPLVFLPLEGEVPNAVRRRGCNCNHTGSARYNLYRKPCTPSDPCGATSPLKGEEQIALRIKQFSP